jgi:hypothetical protein
MGSIQHGEVVAEGESSARRADGAQYCQLEHSTKGGVLQYSPNLGDADLYQTILIIQIGLVSVWRLRVSAWWS